MSINNEIYTIILCGGIGERLWPYSTPKMPKPLIPFIENKSLLEHTLNRCKVITNKIWITTQIDQKEEVAKIAGNEVEKILIEPSTKNTAAAILLSALELYDQNPEAVIAFLPSDAYIKDYLNFSEYIKIAAAYSYKSNQICLFGLEPKFAATGYGYIEIGEVLNNKFKIYKTNKFHEKPTKQIAEKYLAENNKLWNVGIFVGKVITFIEEFKRHAPDIYFKILQYKKTYDQNIYDSIIPISFDCAIVEKSHKINVILVNFDWYDVGNLETFLTLKSKEKNQNIIELDSSNNLVDIKNKIVALIGVNDLCIVEQNNALVIVHRSKVEDVKKINQFIKETANKSKNNNERNFT